MQITVFLILIALLLAHVVVSSLAIMQVRRFKGIKETNQWAIWSYISISTILGVAVIITFFTIDF